MQNNPENSPGSPRPPEQRKRDGILSFKPVGQPLELDDLKAEFDLMRGQLKKEMTAAVAQSVCEKSGTHLLKLVSPRTEGDHAILNVQNKSANRRVRPIPSVNAADIPFAKVLYRPLEIRGRATRTLVDDVLNPDDVSERALAAFAAVFGDDVLEAIRSALLAKPKDVQKLAAGEFPIIFIPRPGGGDIQVTPVSPATSFMGMKVVISPFFEKQDKDGPKVPRGKFHKQAVSAKPQNISGAIGGPRTRLFAEMPPGLAQMAAELYRYVRGGRFPRWREADVDTWVLRYAEKLSKYLDEQTYSNTDMKKRGIDPLADRLIRDAERFAEEALSDARELADRDGIDPDTLKPVPAAGTILLRRRWASDEDFQKARRALSSAHFQDRVRVRRDGREG